MSASLSFLGATGTVTGSRYLVEADSRRILVDCGLFQGYKQLRLRNWSPFPVPPQSIDAVLLTHAHLDHSGYLPALVRDGFRGKVHCTAATAELCGLLLPDSGHLQEEEARYAQRKHYSKHKNPLPLYTEDDAKRALQHLEVISFDRALEIGESLEARFLPAGHLLGAAQISLQVGSRSIHFTGDLGRKADPLMREPTSFEGADILVCESTYGNRKHQTVDAERELASIINRVVRRGGAIIIPAFAVGRIQGVMLQIARLRQSGAIPYIPVFLNSPMGISATDIYHRFHNEHHVSREECEAMNEVAERVRTVEESKDLNRRQGPFIVVSASGMLTGGRVLHHLASFGPDPKNAIVLSGFQAGGTRGAALVRGERNLRIFGREVEIKAEVVELGSLSGHADADELIGWMRNAPPPEMTYVTHGEPESADALRFRIEHELGWAARVPEHLERVSLDAPQ
ncbi:MBL fold metallo-hydrolase [Allopontixanthobacter sp.]|uniref:MBL fold metallo-hydrolase n=1 Tax=Allopontixanthobacter sp. TaxID=2906452 RepID=UPI002AC8D1AF|nr:MBL fold metallo-hydrolase [Allopontixanthobacter sp.]